MSVPATSFEVYPSKQPDSETVYVHIRVGEAGAAHFYLTQEQARELADELQEAANWLSNTKTVRA